MYKEKLKVYFVSIKLVLTFVKSFETRIFVIFNIELKSSIAENVYNLIL